ncbi:MAG: chemotaxis protein CheD [Syntrophomonadaceae bacterium]|jgi:chemotaxis protein CheD|nr:chemotaxis protein CheD [Syntrophomonadaceae bacterium]
MDNQMDLVEYKVGIAECHTCIPPVRLVALGLGSCVGVVILDVSSGIGGMVHIMLPESRSFTPDTNPAKFADTGIPFLFEEVIRIGACKKRMEAKIAGGAQMFKSSTNSMLLNIGERNIEACRQVLGKLNIKITGSDVGGSSGRTMVLDSTRQKIFVRQIGKEPREI